MADQTADLSGWKGKIQRMQQRSTGHGKAESAQAEMSV